MAGKKIKVALKLKEGVEARNLQELKEAFDLNQIIDYFLDGKLETWLLDRYYKDLAEKVSNLDKSDLELRRKLCEIFEVEYGEDSLSIEEIEERNRRIRKLKEITDEEDIIKNVDKVAFCQEELTNLLDKGQKTIYLCGTGFHIPVSKKGIRYIGVETKLEITEEDRKKYESNNIELINLLNGGEAKEAEKYQPEETIDSSCNDIHAIVLCEDDEERFLAYVTKEAESYKSEDFNETNLASVQYRAHLKKIESFSLNIRTYLDAFYKENKIIYKAEDGQGEFLAVMDCNGENNKILRRFSEDSKRDFGIEYAGKNYILVTHKDFTVQFGLRSKRDAVRISIEGTVDKIEDLYSLSDFYEMPQGFFSINNDFENKGIVLYQLLNEETQIRTSNISIKDYSIHKYDEEHDRGGIVYPVYNDTDTGRIYFFWEPRHESSHSYSTVYWTEDQLFDKSYDWIDGKGYFYYLDIDTKEANRAVYQSILLDIKDFVVKDTKIIYFEKNNESFCLTALDMNSGRKEYLWEKLDGINKYSRRTINLIGEYLYFIIENSEKEKNIYRIKVDGSEKTIIKVDESINLAKVVKICS